MITRSFENIPTYKRVLIVASNFIKVYILFRFIITLSSKPYPKSWGMHIVFPSFSLLAVCDL